MVQNGGNSVSKSHKRVSKFLNWMRPLVAVIVTLIWIFPILWVVMSAFKAPQDIFVKETKWVFEPTLQNFRVVLQESNFLDHLMNSLTIALLSVAVSLTVGIFAAYSIARFFKQNGEPLLLGMLSLRIIPAIVFALPFYLLFQKYDITDSIVSVVLTHLTFNVPFAIWMLSGFIGEVPVELEEAAMVDGCSFARALYRVTLPLAMPGVMVTTFFLFVFSWNDLLYPLVLTLNKAVPLTVYVTTFVQQRAILWGPMCAAATVIVLPPAIFALTMHRHIIRGLTAGALK